MSSAFLGLSLAFIKDIVPLAQDKHLWLLFLSWGSFAVVIVGTIWSFIYGQRIIRRLLEAAQRYYKENDQTAHDESQKYAKSLDRVNEISGFVFIAAVLLSVAFVFVNIPSEVSNVQEEESPGSKSVSRSSAAKIPASKSVSRNSAKAAGSKAAAGSKN